MIVNVSPFNPHSGFLMYKDVKCCPHLINFANRLFFELSHSKKNVHHASFSTAGK